MNASGINQGTSGNLSIRIKDGFLITPSGIPYKLLKVEDICFVPFTGGYYGKYGPSSEWRFHKDIYLKKPDANAILHAHSTHCIALSVHKLSL